jgi:hypothetical protein
MYEILKALAAVENWVFEYGRTDFQNLYNGLDNKNVSHLFLDPPERSKKRNDSGVVESIVYSGNFMLLYSSDIDETSYEYRYTNYIKPILDSQIAIIEEDLICEHEATLEEWKELEVINMFDQNLDGVLVTYRVSIDV